VASREFGLCYPEALEALKGVGELTLLPPLRRDVPLGALSDCDVLIIGDKPRLDGSVLAKLKSLRVVALHAPSLNIVDLDVATERGVIVLRPLDLISTSVAEHAIGLLLSLIRRIHEAYRLAKGGRWAERGKLLGRELRGKTMGLICLGCVGRELARMAERGLGLKVLIYDPWVGSDEISELGYERVNLEDLLSSSDIISIQDPLPRKVRGSVNEAVTKYLKRGCVILDVTGGYTFKEGLLQELMEEGRIGGLALDVTEDFLLRNYQLLKHPNVVLTPALSHYTWEGLARVEAALVEDILKVLKGEKPSRVANPEVLKSED